MRIEKLMQMSMQELHDMRLAKLSTGTLDLEVDTAYWMKRAEEGSRSLLSIIDPNATNMAKGQISICYETADENRRTLKEIEEQAKSKTPTKTSERKGATVV